MEILIGNIIQASFFGMMFFLLVRARENIGFRKMKGQAGPIGESGMTMIQLLLLVVLIILVIGLIFGLSARGGESDGGFIGRLGAWEKDVAHNYVPV